MTSTTTAQNAAFLAGRILLASIFILSGVNKIGGYAGTQQYMDAFGVPGALLPLVIIVEIAAGLGLVAGAFTRISALALAGFTLVAGAIFHSNFADQMQMIMFLKNLSITGGLLVLAAAGAGAWSVDAVRAGRTAQVVPAE